MEHDNASAAERLTVDIAAWDVADDAAGGAPLGSSPTARLAAHLAAHLAVLGWRKADPGEGVDWHRTVESANRRLSVLRSDRIAALRRELDQLEALESANAELNS